MKTKYVCHCLNSLLSIFITIATCEEYFNLENFAGGWEGKRDQPPYNFPPNRFRGDKNLIFS